MGRRRRRQTRLPLCSAIDRIRLRKRSETTRALRLLSTVIRQYFLAVGDVASSRKNRRVLLANKDTPIIAWQGDFPPCPERSTRRITFTFLRAKTASLSRQRLALDSLLSQCTADSDSLAWLERFRRPALPLFCVFAQDDAAGSRLERASSTRGLQSPQLSPSLIDRFHWITCGKAGSRPPACRSSKAKASADASTVNYPRSSTDGLVLAQPGLSRNPGSAPRVQPESVNRSGMLKSADVSRR